MDSTNSPTRMSKVLDASVSGKSKHYSGLPPILTGGVDTRKLMPQTHLLVLVELPDQHYSLTRYSESGEFAGDTWHATLEEAFSQADWEFSGKISKWIDVPEGTDDSFEFARTAHFD